MPRLLVWDLDGTLVDSLTPTIDAINDGLEHFLGRRLTSDEIMAMFGPSERNVVARLVGEENVDDCYQRYHRAMKSRLPQVRPFDGILQAIAELATLGFRQTIFTGRGKENTLSILATHFPNGLFERVVTGDDVSKPKPDPEGLLKITTELEISPMQAIMIGDTHLDVGTGRGAGALTIGCLWDTRAARERLGTNPPHHFAETPRALVPLIRAIATGR